MSELLGHLREAVRESSRDSRVALLLSGGLDSISVGIALQAAGKLVRAYTYEVPGHASRDREVAQAAAQHFGWPMTLISVPTRNMRADFLRLAVEHRCRSKVQFEVTYPLLYLMPAIEEQEVWSGWNADDHYGNTRKVILEQHGLSRDGVALAERQQVFEEWRRNRFDGDLKAPGSKDTWWCAQRVASRCGKRLYDPYLHPAVTSFFTAFNHGQLSPLKKPIVREQLKDELGSFADRIAVGIQMQKGGGVDRLFESLIEDDFVNRFTPRYGSVSKLCLRWSQEVALEPTVYEHELSALRPPHPAIARKLRPGDYAPYSMLDVRMHAAEAKFTAISMFSGGGGSSIGYRLAGGWVIAASDFVPEAARTYSRNFPETPLDTRDLRELLTGSGVEDWLWQIGLRDGQLDILDGSPPCAEFSIAGSGLRDPDELRPYSDVSQRNIAGLPFDFIRAGLRMRPKIIIMENVPGLASAPSRQLLEEMLRMLRTGDGERREYFVAWRILSAADFGVPQVRRRLFIIGVRADVAQAAYIETDAAVQHIFPTPTHLPVSIRSAFSGLQQTADDVFPWHVAAACSSLSAAVRALPRDPVRHTRLDANPKYSRLTRCAFDLPALTLVVAGQQPDRSAGLLHPTQDRKFTIPELKRLFSLPEDFVLTGTLAQGAERICRMVPSPLTRAIAESLYRRALRPYKDTQR